MKFKSEKTALCLATAFTALVSCPGVAFAQDIDAAAEEETVIVVRSGTLIRGVDAPASQTITVDQDAITESGASTTAELLGTLPQVSNFFNGRPDIDPRAADRQQVSRPNLRNLPGLNSATGATTLILVDGHRMTPMGVDQASFDPDFIPPGVIQNVEIVTDGGSSLYGADAVGGVINFITRRGFEGIQVDGGYDVGDNYTAYRAAVTAGIGWNGGGAYVAYDFYHRDDILNADRDYAARGSWNATGTVLSPSGSQCISPVGERSTFVYFAPFNVWSTNSALGGSVVPVGTPCDIDGQSSLLPELERHSVMFGLSHELSDSITLDIKANYGESALSYSRYPQGDTVSPPAPTGVGTPFEQRVVNAVGFSYGANSAYVHRNQELDLQVYGITPEITADLGSDWQLKWTGYYGASDNSRRLPSSDRTKLNAYILAGTFNPSNAAAASAAVIADITNWEVAGDANQSLWLSRAVFDGPLFDLPAGPVGLAVGAEYNRDRAALRSGSFQRDAIDNVAFRVATRDVKSVFAELSIPVLNELDLSASARLDDYSDFGSTFNPTFGFNFEPVDGVRFYGHWGESFNAPTALDSVRVADARFIPNASAGVPDPLMERTSNPTRNDVLLIEGSGGGLKPQTATTLAGGFEFEPIDRLNFGASVYDIDFRNLLSSVNPQLASVVLLNPEKFISFPTQAVFNQFLATAANGSQFANVNANDVGVIIDRRVANLAAGRLRGIDFHANYTFDIGIGDLSMGVSGNKQISFKITENGNTVDQLAFDVTDLTVSANVGFESGGFRSRLTLNHSGGFASNTAVAQTRVEAFNVADLFLGYEFGENAGMLEGLAFRLNVDNLFDTDPPVFRQQRNLNYSGFTLGRVFKFGVSKKF